MPFPAEGNLWAGFSVGGLKLILLRIPLRGHPSVRSLAVQLAAGAVVERGMDVDPNLSVRVAHVDRDGRGFG